MNKVLPYIVVIIAALALSYPFIYTAKGNGLFQKPPEPKLVLPESGECVAPTEYMRKNHMNLLLHERDAAVREGIRTTSHSLSNCKTCHTKREEFCDRCHEYAGVKPECFGCHYMP